MALRVLDVFQEAPLSILTAPEGAVQSAAGGAPGACDGHLSILTAPEGTVQSACWYISDRMWLIFQSSPPPKERCNRRPLEAAA